MVEGKRSDLVFGILSGAWQRESGRRVQDCRNALSSFAELQSQVEINRRYGLKLKNAAKVLGVTIWV